MAGSLRVQVESPIVAGDTVHFRWTQSEPNPYQQRNEFFFRYQGVELGNFSSLLFYEIFLALQTKVFAAYKHPVDVTFPEKIPQSTAAYWLTFHGADHVTIAPLSDVISYTPWKAVPPHLPKPRRAAVFFGGGRDSTATTCLLSELYGPDEVLLIQFVMPLRPNPIQMDLLARRQEGLMLLPARENLGVATGMVWTDYQAIFHGLGHERKRPHLELYTAGALPTLLWHGISLATFCLHWATYGALRREDGSLIFRYARSRPEVLATQSKHYRRVLGTALTVTVLNMLISSPVALLVLKERYPAALEQIVMCTAGEVGERWCYRCRNCWGYAVYTLWARVVDLRFDYDRLFGSSPYVREIVKLATTAVAMEGNVVLPPSAGFHFQSELYHVVAGTDVDLIEDRLGSEAYANLVTIKAMLGGRRYPDVEKLPRNVIDLLGIPEARQIAALVAEHVPIVDALTGPWARSDLIYDFDIRMPTRLKQLDHIREAD